MKIYMRNLLNPVHARKAKETLWRMEEGIREVAGNGEGDSCHVRKGQQWERWGRQRVG
jgi:hypothetical protein